MFVCDVNSSDLFIYSPAENGMHILCTIDHNDNFLNGNRGIFYVKFTSVILPEIVSRKRDMIKDKDRELMCMCRRTKFGHMISCWKYNCKFELYHYPCVNITRAPKGRWVCPECRK